MRFVVSSHWQIKRIILHLQLENEMCLLKASVERADRFVEATNMKLSLAANSAPTLSDIELHETAQLGAYKQQVL